MPEGKVFNHPVKAEKELLPNFYIICLNSNNK